MTEKMFTSLSEMNTWLNYNCDNCRKRRTCDIFKWICKAEFKLNGEVPNGVAMLAGFYDHGILRDMLKGAWRCEEFELRKDGFEVNRNG